MIHLLCARNWRKKNSQKCHTENYDFIQFQRQRKIIVCFSRFYNSHNLRASLAPVQCMYDLTPNATRWKVDFPIYTILTCGCLMWCDIYLCMRCVCNAIQNCDFTSERMFYMKSKLINWIHMKIRHFWKNSKESFFAAPWINVSIQSS